MSIGTYVRLLACFSLVPGLTGCVVHEAEADATFLWEFVDREQVVSCGAAGVDYLDVWVEDLDDGSVDEIIDVPCDSYGVELQELDAGWYYVAFYDVTTGRRDLLWDEEVRLRSGDNEITVQLPSRL